jgi:hypothetical protein
MTISETITRLQEIQAEHGDIDLLITCEMGYRDYRVVDFDVRPRVSSYFQGYFGTSGDCAIEAVWDNF